MENLRFAGGFRGPFAVYANTAKLRDHSAGSGAQHVMLLSSVAPIALFAFWEPIGGIVWSIESPVAQALIYGAFAFAAMATNIHPPKVPDTRAVPEEARLS